MKRERTDAARNRAKILAAAAGIVAERGVQGLSMAEVAAAAGVGVGTLYRRFGDRSGLAYALIDQREREFQSAFIEGPPPLGPGAEPRERVRAFLSALADRTVAQLDLLLMADAASSMSRFGGAYTAYHGHLAMLIAQVKPGADAFCLADALLAPLAAPLVAYRTRSCGVSLERLKAALDALVDGL
ncbi:TetR/AcrR family transcriptional regulator [Nonomuraea sp. NPDC048916]|uniref:TetR/AcrR family transcriptional regulator n=1 Tax=Nonomuraea sp. NPDC048916 TaxID=3154232 RepID=UPI0033D776C2